MKRALGLAATAFLLISCGSNETSPTALKQPLTTTVTQTKALSTPRSTQPAEPTVVKCVDGSADMALWSDGSERPSELCRIDPASQAPTTTSTAPAARYQCPQTDAFVNDPSECAAVYAGAQLSQQELDLSQIPIADGGTCPAYLCGYGTDENGNPNPSSGEIQGLDGCENGYITDEEYCAAIYERFGYQ
ncbi:hypothetical protein CMUST_04580 [Corynebacterium mustelae]|uniref:Uncharacterized protein n=1 Tax=Corynebacterium mustelae TaxID=571915 RepID=A0A0G3H0B7_9CORY|nr:hypothetical protein [Corynebacterium mustelae]AKK05258.1 hypothetical protein CMUST_04580 [Corynebacterium mustelae]